MPRLGSGLWKTGCVTFGINLAAVITDIPFPRELMAPGRLGTAWMTCIVGTDETTAVVRTMGRPVPCVGVHASVAVFWFPPPGRVVTVSFGLTARTVLFGYLEANGNRMPDKGDIGLGAVPNTAGLVPVTVEVARYETVVATVACWLEAGLGRAVTKIVGDDEKANGF